MQFFAGVSDCMAQCAVVFGGGIAEYGRLRLIELLRYTHKAVGIAKGGGD